MNRTVHFIVALFFMTSLFTKATSAQSIESQNDLIHFNHISTKLDKATGWFRSRSADKWISHENAISGEQKLFNTNDTATCEFSFRWMQWASFDHNNQTYYALIFERKSGSYKYPALREGWELSTDVHFEVYTSAQYSELKQSLEKKKGKDFVIATQIRGDVGNNYLTNSYQKAEVEMYKKITSLLDEKERLPYEHTFVVNAKRIDNKDVVRFLLPAMSESDYYLRIQYFEVPFEEFTKILI
jgi:hypothetical protein